MKVHKIIDQYRKKAEIQVTKFGPMLGMSPAWGQKVLDGTIYPNLTKAQEIADILGMSADERLDLVTAVAEVKLKSAGLSPEQVAAVLKTLRNGLK